MAKNKTEVRINYDYAQAKTELLEVLKKLQDVANGKPLKIDVKANTKSIQDAMNKGAKTVSQKINTIKAAYQSAYSEVAKIQANLNKTQAKNIVNDAEYKKVTSNVANAYRQVELLKKRFDNEMARNNNQAAPFALTKAQIAETQRILNMYDGDFARAFKGITNNAKTFSADFNRNFTLSKTMSTEAVKINNLGIRISSYMQRFSASLKTSGFYSQFDDLLGKVNRGEFRNFDTALNSFSSLQRAARDAGVEIDNYGQRLSKTFGSRIRSDLAAIGTGFIMTGITDLYRNVVNVDTAMTELKKVTDETAASYNQFTTDAIARSKEIGAVLSETINATADYARLGYNIQDASTLADSSLIYLNVGDDLQGIDDASGALISTMQGFGIEAENAMHIVDAFNEVSNKFAVTSGGIGEGVRRSAAAMSAAGNSLEQTIGLFTAADTIVQDSDVVGTALKTSYCLFIQ